MHFLDNRPVDEAITDVGLICHDDKGVAGILESAGALGGSRVDAEIQEFSRRK
jgi:hypothetical protein